MADDTVNGVQIAGDSLRERLLPEKENAHVQDVPSNVSDDGRSSSSSCSTSSNEVGAARKLGQEFWRVLVIAMPISLVDSAAYVAGLVGVAQVGKLGYIELSALTLGNTFYNLTGSSILVGMTTGMDGIGGQVYGAGQYTALGVLLQRACLACSLVCLPIYALWTQAGWMLQLLGQDPQVSTMATQYIWQCSPCLLLSTVRMCCKSYFSSQGVVLPLTVLTAFSMIASPFFNYFFITWLDLRLVGAAMAYVIEEVATLVLCIGMMVWLHFRQLPEERTWGGFSGEAFKGWSVYFQVAVPSMVMVCLDWWVLEVMVLLSGLGSSSGVQVAAMGLLFNAFTFIYYVCDGFGSAASTRVSNELGARNSKAAKLACSMAICMGLAACCFWCALMYLTQQWWLRLFTNEAVVMEVFSECMPYVCAAVVGYSTNTIVSGVLRGSARAGLGLWINFLSLWLVGLPLAASLALYWKMGPRGLWIGIAVMNLLQGGMLTVSVLRFNWREEVKRSQSFVSLCITTPLLTEPGELDEDYLSNELQGQTSQAADWGFGWGEGTGTDGHLTMDVVQDPGDGEALSSPLLAVRTVQGDGGLSLASAWAGAAAGVGAAAGEGAGAGAGIEEGGRKPWPWNTTGSPGAAGDAVERVDGQALPQEAGKGEGNGAWLFNSSTAGDGGWEGGAAAWPNDTMDGLPGESAPTGSGADGVQGNPASRCEAEAGTAAGAGAEAGRSGSGVVSVSGQSFSAVVGSPLELWVLGQTSAANTAAPLDYIQPPPRVVLAARAASLHRSDSDSGSLSHLSGTVAASLREASGRMSAGASPARAGTPDPQSPSGSGLAGVRPRGGLRHATSGALQHANSTGMLSALRTPDRCDSPRSPRRSVRFADKEPSTPTS